MRGLARRLRSRYDYTFFMARNEWPLLLSVAGAILGIVTILPSSVGIGLGVVAFVLGVGAFMRDWLELRRRWADYEFTRIAAPFPTATISPPGAYPDPLYLYVPNRGTALVSGPVDQAVASQPMDARLDEDLYRLPKSLKASARYVLPKVNYGRLVFNGKIIGMRGDPLPPESSSPPPIRLHIAEFFDAQCSNEMCTLQVTHRNGERDFDPRVELLTSSNGQLRTLAESILADCIGISTVAFTSDNALVVTRQSSRNIASAQLLAPSGSGSLDPRDLGAASTGRPRRGEILQDIVRRGMERELEEETGIRQDEIRCTQVTRFRPMARARRQARIFWCHNALSHRRGTQEEPSDLRRATLYRGHLHTQNRSTGAWPRPGQRHRLAYCSQPPPKNQGAGFSSLAARPPRRSPALRIRHQIKPASRPAGEVRRGLVITGL